MEARHPQRGETAGKNMGTKDAKPLPVFKKLDVSKMKTPQTDELGCTWGSTQDGIVVEHN
jgi:hypothetical protein